MKDKNEFFAFEFCCHFMMFIYLLFYEKKNIPRVRSDVTPRVTRAGMASGLIQKAIHDITTIRAEGMYV